MMTYVARLALLALLANVAPARSVAPQQSQPPLHATLAGWADDTWLLVLDRNAIHGGRLGPQGMLARFHRVIDAEYALDWISAVPSLTEDYAFQRSTHGVRYWGGSINHRDLIEGATFKTEIRLAGSWRFGARLDRLEQPALERNTVRIGFRSGASGWYGFADGSLTATKPDMDVVVGGGWCGRAGEVRVGVALLDVFSDVIYQGLVVWEGYADTALDYERHPIALRALVTRWLGESFRIEAHGAVLRPSRVRAYRQVAPATGFRQDESFAYGAVLAEWSVSPRLTVGGMLTSVRAVSDREPLPQSAATDDFLLRERTTDAKAYLLAAPHARWLLEAWAGRQWRPETRSYRRQAAADVNYEDRAWQGQAILTYRARSGFRSLAAFEADLREVVRGPPPVPEQDGLGQHNTRLRLELGWQVERRAHFMAGYRIDLDFDRAWFDGAHGRFVLFW